MTFIEACGMIYMRELQKDHDKEIAEDDYKPQKAFGSCGERAKSLSYDAERAVDNFRALCILLHREKTTDEIYEEESARLKLVMPEEDVKLAEAYGWWKP